MMPKMIKKKNMVTVLMLASLIYGSHAGGTELNQEDGILSNHSTEYVRTLNRNTSTDPDAAFYNPAGLAFMQHDGLYINYSNQTYYAKKTHTMNFYGLKKGSGPIDPPPHKQTSFLGNLPDEYMAETTAPVLPGLDIIWKQDSWAAYLDIAVMQACLPFKYGDGLGVIDWGNLLAFETGLTTEKLISYSSYAQATRREMYVGATVGGAYEFMNMIAAGCGLRVIHAQGNMKLDIRDINYITDPGTGLVSGSNQDWNIDTDTSGFGVGFILSTHFRPEALAADLRGLNATFRFEYYLPMELKKTTNSFIAPNTIEQSGNLDIFKDGKENSSFNGGAGYGHGNGSDILKATYAPSLNFGLSYLLLGWINLQTSAQISLRSMRDLDGREKDYNLGYQLGGGVEFILNPKITLSTGYIYNDFGIKPSKRTEADPLLCSHSVGAGGKFSVDENLDINLGCFYQIYVPATTFDEKYVNVSEETMSYIRRDYDEIRYSVSFGVTYRMLGSTSVPDERGDADKLKTSKISERKKGKYNL